MKLLELLFEHGNLYMNYGLGFVVVYLRTRVYLFLLIFLVLIFFTMFKIN